MSRSISATPPPLPPRRFDVRPLVVPVPVPAVAPASQPAVPYQIDEDRRGAGEQREVGVGEWKFGGGALQVRTEDVRVRRIDHGLLDGSAEHGLRVVNEIRVERIVAGDEHRGGPPPGPAGAPDLLPHRRDRARPAGDDDRVQSGDVDAELERVRRRQPEDLAGAQLGLQRPPVFGEVPGAVRRDPARQLRRGLGQRAPCTGGDDLRGQPRADERERARSLDGEVGEEVSRFAQGAATRRRVVRAGRRFVECEIEWAVPGGVSADLGDRKTDQAARRSCPARPSSRSSE